MRLTIILVLLSFSTLAQLESSALRDQYPTFEVTASFLNGKIPSPIDSHTFDLSKRPDGVYLNVSRFNDSRWLLVDSFRIWDLETKKFFLPDMENYFYQGPQKPDFDWKELKYKALDYDFYLFTGYPNWSADLKRYIYQRENYTPYELESLARLYSAEALACIQPFQSGNLVGAAQDYKPAYYQPIEEKRVTEFINAADSSLYFYHTIMKAYPDYQLHIIANVHTKLGNEYVFFWHMLKSIHEDEKALQYLDACTYPESALDYARSLINACKDSSILFSNGDSDTFILWYLQEKQGLRKDVLVINTSLLLTQWYPKMLRKSSTLQFGLSEQEYSYLQNHSYFVFDDQKDNPVNFELSLDAVREFCSNGNSNQNPYPQIPATFSIERDGFAMEPRPRNYYLDLSEFTQFDIIYSNPERAIFSSSFYTLYNLGFLEFIVPWSISCELSRSPSKGSEQHYEEHTQRMLNFLKNIDKEALFHWTHLNRSQLATLMYDLARFDDSHEKEQATVWAELTARFNFEWVTSTKDEFLIPSYFNMLELLNREDFEQLYALLLDDLEDYLDTLSWKQLSAKNGIAQLEYYIRLFNRPTDRRAKFMLIKKLETLLAVREVQQYLWTPIAVERLLNRIDID